MSPTQPTGDSPPTGRAPRPSPNCIDSRGDAVPHAAYLCHIGDAAPHADDRLDPDDPFAGVVE